MSPPFRRPMNATKRPMPAAIALRMLGLMESSTASRTPITDRIRKMMPETKTMPSATRHGSGHAGGSPAP